jgi:hypothetical protein
MAFLGSSAVRLCARALVLLQSDREKEGSPRISTPGASRRQPKAAARIILATITGQIAAIKMEIGPRIYRNFDLGGPISWAICNACVCVCSTPASITLLPWLGCVAAEEREREVNHNSCAPKRECGCAPQCLNHPARCCTHDFTRPLSLSLSLAHRQPVYNTGNARNHELFICRFLPFMCCSPAVFCSSSAVVPNPSRVISIFESAHNRHSNDSSSSF